MKRVKKFIASGRRKSKAGSADVQDQSGGGQDQSEALEAARIARIKTEAARIKAAEAARIKAALCAAEARRKTELLEARAAEYAKTAATLAGNKRPMEEEPAMEPVAKRVKFMFNPFLVEKSRYTRQIFQVNNPFVCVETRKTLEEMVPDKICDGEVMDEDALAAAVRILLRPVALLRRQYKQARTELGGRIMHAGICMNLKLLTRPHRSSAVPRPDEEIKGRDGEQEDLEFRAGGEYVPKLLNPPSDDSDEFATEGSDPFDPLELLKSNKYDFNGLVHDNRLDPENDLATVLMVECEWDKLSINKSYHGAGYCMKKARQNMEKGRYEPIYVQAWGESAWRHAIFTPEAIVEVKDGHVVYASDHFDPVNLDMILQKKTTQLQADYEQVMKFPDGKYVKGIYRVCTKKLYFPLGMIRGSWEMAELRLFYLGLLRIFIGDRVLNWTREDVMAAVIKREQELTEDIDGVFESATSRWRKAAVEKRRRSQDH